MRHDACACVVTMLLGLWSAGPGWAGTEGTASTFYGFGAGTSNSSDGNGNTFIGAYAGYYTDTGAANTFLGHSAGEANTNGDYNTFLGSSAGFSNTTGVRNTFLGYNAGYHNTSGNYNTFLGLHAGISNTSGYYNTFLGQEAGFSNTTGYYNVFLGLGAGYSETGSNKLYIDNCLITGCMSPLIYGEFDNHLLRINGVTHVAADGVAKSQMHFSLDNGDYGGFLTSVLPNNFFVSSGARYDSGNWVQRSADGNAVMAGSGGAGYRIFTHTGTAVGNTFTNPTLRLYIDYSGQFGINTAPVAGHEIHTATGAYETGGAWVDGSSRELKDNIRKLSAEDAMQALAALDPVTFSYKSDRAWHHVGFIAEDVPQLVAAPDRKGLAPMDIVAVLTKVVQEKSRIVDDQRAVIAWQQRMLESIEARLARLEKTAPGTGVE